jgi:uncharacterized membrane protein
MKDFPEYKKLEFKKLKTGWEHHRATIFNYTIGLITILIFGLKYLVVEIGEKGYFRLAFVFLILIVAISLSAIYFICDRMKKIEDIKKGMERIIKESKK